MLAWIGLGLFGVALYTACYLHVNDWDECRKCGWLTKLDNGKCAGCGRPRK